MAGHGEVCFHCGEDLPADRVYEVSVDGTAQRVCCPGCQAVATLIASAGYGDYYRFREAPPPRPDELELEAAQWRVYDREELKRQFVSRLADGSCEAGLVIEGVRCAACSWLIERSLGREPGVNAIEVNPATGRARLCWDPEQAPLSRLLWLLARLGYRPHPATAGAAEAAARRERNQALKRLAVAGLGMMQVMMFAVALYAGAFQGMDPTIREFLRLVSLLVATPVALYAGWPFFAGAVGDLRAGSPGMDVPVALAIGGAYAASVWNSLAGSGEVYFDSVTMFVFFLSLGRYLEMTARHRAGSSADALAQLQPATCLRLRDGHAERVGVAELELGDLVLVRPGEVVPCDGVIVRGDSGLDESLLTGESRPVTRGPGDAVTGGSSNVSQALTIRVERLGADTVIAGIARLLRRAQAERPPIARLADRVAAHFVTGVLVAALLVGIYWWQSAPGEAFPIVLSVLVVTCPCALSLATPTALTAASGLLSRCGALVTRGGALETLAKADRFVFDKTGTLTQGQLEISEARHARGADPRHCLAIAAALESHSAHPIAGAFAGVAQLPAADEIIAWAGGVAGKVGGRSYRLGRPDLVLAAARQPEQLVDGDETASGSWLLLADEETVLAAYRLEDIPRSDAQAVINSLRAEGIDLEIASGDSRGPVAELAGRLAIPDYHARLLPAEKLDRIRAHQARGETVAMVGDGVNDAPVLAGADVSIAMGKGASLAQNSADIVLLGNLLAPLLTARITARRALRVIRQNLAWAIAYNCLALPLAAAGWVQPWMAAIGMSTSSLVVVLNALRIGRDRRPAAGGRIEASQGLTPEVST